MKIFIGSDHRGFELKGKLIDWLKSEGHEVEDCGNSKYDPLDDYVDFANCVTDAVCQVRQSTGDNEVLGIVICGSGVGVSVAANRHKGIICALGFDSHQIAHARRNDHINVLALPSNYVEFEKAKEIVMAFLTAKPKSDEKYLRRAKKLDE